MTVNTFGPAVITEQELWEVRETTWRGQKRYKREFHGFTYHVGCRMRGCMFTVTYLWPISKAREIAREHAASHRERETA